MKWTQDLRIRSVVKSTGAVLRTFAPATPPMVADPNYDWEQLDRRLANGGDDPVPQGWRPKITLSFLCRAGRIKGASGFCDLEDVLSDASSRLNALELALHGSDYKRVYILAGSITDTPIEGKYIGLQRDIEFQATQRQATYPKRDGGAW